MIPSPYLVSEASNGGVRVTGPTGWWVEFKTMADAEELWGLVKDYLDKPKPN